MNFQNFAASAAAGLIGAMGLGGGGILIIYLTKFLNYEQLKSQGINLIFFIPTAIIAIIIHCRNRLIKFRKIIPFIISAIPGVIFGLYLTTVISGKILSCIFGIILIVIGAKELLTKKRD